MVSLEDSHDVCPLLVEEAQFEIPLPKNASVSQLECWRDFIILNVVDNSSSMMCMYNRRSKMNREIRFDGLISLRVLLLSESEQDVLVVLSSFGLAVYKLPTLELSCTRRGIISSVVSVNNALEKIVLYCKKARTVQIMNSKLEKEAFWSLRNEVKQLLLLDNGNVYALVSSGSCFLLEREGRNKVTVMLSNENVWHSIYSSSRRLPDQKRIKGSRKSMAAIFIDSQGHCFYADNRGNIVETPLSFRFLPDFILPTHLGLLCGFSPGQANNIDILIEFPRHDIDRLMQHLSDSTKYHFIRSLNEDRAVQMIADGLDSHEIISWERSIEEAFHHHISVYKINQIAFRDLIGCLIDDKLFDTALDLIDRQRDPSDGQKHDLEMHVLYELSAYQIYEEKDYRNGMLNLSMSCRNNTVEMLLFFNFLLPVSLQGRARKYIQSSLGGNVSNISELVKNIEEDEKEEVANSLLPYLWSYRTRILGDTSKTGGLEQTLLDSAIFNCLLRSVDDGALLQFLQRRDVMVDYETGRMLLQQNERYIELLELYKSQGHHSTAMDLLKMLSEAEPSSESKVSIPSGKSGAWEAARYLSSISNPELSLIKFHSRWMMRIDPASVVDMLLRMHPTISTSMAVSILSRDGSVSSISQAASYLEKILSLGKDGIVSNSITSEECKHTLVELYLRIVILNRDFPEVSKDALSKLEHFFQSENAVTIDFHGMLKILPPKIDSTPDILEARVLILEKINLHQEALEILIFDIRDHSKAEKYCKRASQNSNDKESIYLILLELVVSHQDRTDVLKEGLSIISQCLTPELLMRSYVRLSEGISLGIIYQYLRSSLCVMKECQRKVGVSKHLERGRLQSIAMKRTICQEGNLVIQAERRCGICFKKLGVSAHIYDGTSIFHYSCYKNLNCN